MIKLSYNLLKSRGLIQHVCTLLKIHSKWWGLTQTFKMNWRLFIFQSQYSRDPSRKQHRFLQSRWLCSKCWRSELSIWHLIQSYIYSWMWEKSQGEKWCLCDFFMKLQTIIEITKECMVHEKHKRENRCNLLFVYLKTFTCTVE